MRRRCDSGIFRATRLFSGRPALPVTEIMQNTILHGGLGSVSAPGLRLPDLGSALVSPPMQTHNTAKRDFLIKIQEEAQAKWEAAKIFEVDAPADGEWVPVVSLAQASEVQPAGWMCPAHVCACVSVALSVVVVVGLDRRWEAWECSHMHAGWKGGVPALEGGGRDPERMPLGRGSGCMRPPLCAALQRASRQRSFSETSPTRT